MVIRIFVICFWGLRKRRYEVGCVCASYVGDVLGGTRVVCMRGADCSGCRWRGGAARAAVVGDDAAARAARAPPLHHPARPALARRTQERGMYYTLL